MNLIIFKAEVKPLFRCLDEDLRALKRGEVLLVLEHEHGKFIEKFIIDGVEDIAAALAAVRTAENIVDELKFILEFEVDTVFFGDRTLNWYEFGLCDLHRKLLIADEVERNDIAVPNAPQNFGTLDLVVEIIFDDPDELLRNILICAAVGDFGSPEVGRKDDDALAEIGRYQECGDWVSLPFRSRQRE